MFKWRYKPIIIVCNTALVIALLVSDPAVSQTLSTVSSIFSEDDSQSATLAVAAATARGVDRQARAMAYRELIDEKLAPVFGGKGAFDKLLEDLAPKIRFSVVSESVRFTIQEIWGRFIALNSTLVEEGNDLIERDMRERGSVSNETRKKLQGLIAELSFPKDLRLFIWNRTDHLKGWVIARSSGRREDSFLRNLAGIFISPLRRDRRLVTQGIKAIFKDAIKKIWIEQNDAEVKWDGVPTTLSAEEGFGVLVQPFVSFDASGTAMTDLYNHVSVEAVIGDASSAVRSAHATRMPSNVTPPS
jgi:hypothetical protein